MDADDRVPTYAGVFGAAEAGRYGDRRYRLRTPESAVQLVLKAERGS
jgi:hypothetical protein